MSNIKILFRIPLTIYFLAWDKDSKAFLLTTKRFNSRIGYYFRHIG